jgi:hypothetical protein
MLRNRQGQCAARLAAVAVAAWVAGTIGAAGPARAAFLTGSPTGVGTLRIDNVAGPNPRTTYTAGGATLFDFAQPAEGGSIGYSILKFDLAPLAGGASVSAAFLDLTVATAQTVTSSPRLGLNGLGSITAAVTAADFPLPPSFTVGTALFTSGVIPSQPPVVTPLHIDVTGFVQGMAGGGPRYAAFFTYFSGPGGSVTLYGDDPANAAGLRPTLSVTFTPAATPEPASAVLVGLGGGLVAAVGAVRRWKRGRRAIAG